MSGTKMVKPKTRTPKCSRCQYHGIVRELKGHKRFCPFQNCLCNKCELNVARRKIMAAQLALKHHNQEMSILQTENTTRDTVSLSSSSGTLMRTPVTSTSSSTTFFHDMVLQHRQNDQHYAMQQLQNHFIQGAGLSPSDSLLRMPSANNSSTFPHPNMVLPPRQNDSRYTHTVHHMMLEDKNMQLPDKRMSPHLMPTTTTLPPYHSSGYF